MLQYDADKRPSVHRMLESKFLQSYIHQYEKKERINVHTCIRTASDRNMNGMRTRERQLQKESREKAIKALSPNIHKIRKHQRQLSFEFEQNRKARRGRIDNRNELDFFDPNISDAKNILNLYKKGLMSKVKLFAGPFAFFIINIYIEF